MEGSPANRLPEADSLPDGFVESSAEPPTAHPRSPDFIEGSLDLDRSDEAQDGPLDSEAAENPPSDGSADGAERIASSTDSFPGKEGLHGCCGSVEDKEGNGLPEDYKEIKLSQSQDELLIGLPSKDSRGEYQSSEDTKRCLESHITDLKERSSTEYTDCSKNRKLESVEVKRKVGKRNIKSDKELLEFTLKYQKVIAERDAAVAVRERLESLCRELQRQNKMLMDECQRVSTEGQNMRLDLSTKFNDAIKDVGIKLEEQKDECLSQLKENETLRNKLKHLADQYALSEQQFAQKLKQKMLELQLADLKIQQHQERSAQEQSQMQLYVEQVTQLLATEKNLRLQLAADGEKFQQFQDALLKSNEVFETFKQEMEKMAKLIKELKKDNEFLKGKCEKSDIALVKLVEERELMKKQIEKVKNQKEKLESLCRSLQAERKQISVASANAISVTEQQVKASPVDEDS